MNKVPHNRALHTHQTAIHSCIASLHCQGRSCLATYHTRLPSTTPPNPLPRHACHRPSCSSAPTTLPAAATPTIHHKHRAQHLMTACSHTQPHCLLLLLPARAKHSRQLGCPAQPTTIRLAHAAAMQRLLCKPFIAVIQHAPCVASPASSATIATFRQHQHPLPASKGWA